MKTPAYYVKLGMALTEASEGNPGRASALASELHGDIQELATERLEDARKITGGFLPRCNTHYACERWGCQGGCKR
jgi:hypothetical protein